MPDGVFAVSVLTPEAGLLDTEARAIVLRSSDGDLTILDGHTPLITDVVPGAMRVDTADDGPVRIAVHGGYMHVETGPGLDGTEARSTRVTVLVGVAELADTIDVARAERARDEAQARVDELRSATGRGGASGVGAAAGGATLPTGEAPASPEEIELVECEAALRRAEVRIEVAGQS